MDLAYFRSDCDMTDKERVNLPPRESFLVRLNAARQPI